MLFYTFSQKFEAKSDHYEAVSKLNKLRNKFIHFIPEGWSLKLSGLPQVCLYCLEIIEFLCWKSGNILWYDVTQKERTYSALEKAKKFLTYIKQTYDKV